MDFKQLKILALALSLPGIIFILSMLYKFLVDNGYLKNQVAIILLGIFLIGYVGIIIKTLTNK